AAWRRVHREPNKCRRKRPSRQEPCRARTREASIVGSSLFLHTGGCCPTIGRRRGAKVQRRAIASSFGDITRARRREATSLLDCATSLAVATIHHDFDAPS